MKLQQLFLTLITVGTLLLSSKYYCSGAPAVLPEETKTEIEIEPNQSESESEPGANEDTESESESEILKTVPLKGIFNKGGNKNKGKGNGKGTTGGKNQGSGSGSGSQNIECMKDLDKLEMLQMIREMTGMVEEGLAAGGTLIMDEATRASYLGYTTRVMASWKGGWEKEDMIDAVSSSISDPLKEIPTVGPMTAFTVKAAIRTYLTRRKTAAGC